MTAHGGFVVTALVALLLSGCGRDANPPAALVTDGPPPLGPVRTTIPPAPIEQVLANGLRVVVVPRAGSSLVAIEFVVLAGSAADPPDRPGLAAFAASLLGRGSATPGGPRTAHELAAAVETLGSHLQTRAGRDASRIGLTVTTPKLAAALDLLADVVRHPTRSPAEIERLRAQTRDSLRLAAGDPAQLAAQVATRLVHGGGPYGHPAYGTERSVTRITAADLAALHRRHLRPDRAALVLAGDLAPDTAAALAAQVFGDWNPTPSAPPTVTPLAEPPAGVPRPTAAAPSVLVIDLPDAGQATVVAAVALPARSAPDHVAGLVAGAVLGGGYSSRLNREIRIRRGLSYDAGADFVALRGAGELYASAQTRNDAAAVVLGLIRAEFSRLATEPVPENELAARKASLLGSRQRQLETTEGLAAEVAERLALGLPTLDPDPAGSAIASVTAADVQRYARAHLADGAFRYLVIGDARHFEAALRDAGYRVERLAADMLNLEAPMLGRGGSGF